MATPYSQPGDSRLTVTVLSVSERAGAVLDAYFKGPGRGTFIPSSEAVAQVGIADLDHPGSRSHMEQFRSRFGRPVIVMSMAEQLLPDTVWVSKPVSPHALEEAAIKIRVLLNESASQLALAVPAGRPGDVHRSEPAATDDGISLQVGQAPDSGWSARRPVAPPQAQPPKSSGAMKPMVLGVVALGVLALGGVFLFKSGGSGGSGTGTVAATASGQVPGQELATAVTSSVQEYKGGSASEKAFVAAQLAQVSEKGKEEDVQARLDRLAANPAALAEYNRNVINKVHVTGSERSTAAEKNLRTEIESILADAARSAGSDGFAASLSSEARHREDEMRTIEVQRGDTLSSIAQRAYGDAGLYQRIFDANPRILSSPNHIFPGQLLRVPKT